MEHPSSLALVCLGSGSFQAVVEPFCWVSACIIQATSWKQNSKKICVGIDDLQTWQGRAAEELELKPEWGGFTSKVRCSERWGLGRGRLLLAGWLEQKPVDGGLAGAAVKVFLGKVAEGRRMDWAVGYGSTPDLVSTAPAQGGPFLHPCTFVGKTWSNLVGMVLGRGA